MEAYAIVILVLIALFVLYTIYKGVWTVREKEVMIVERFGKFHSVLGPGVHWLWFFMDVPKPYDYRYAMETAQGRTRIVESKGNPKILLQTEVLDFPKQKVITRDNAMISLDAILSYQILNGAAAKTMIYSVYNLPDVLCKLLHAHLRNVAATLDVDQIIEDAASLNVLTQLLNDTAMKWGVKINFVKIQRVEADELTADLALKKNADLRNKEVVISAKSAKQTRILQAEGERDSIVKTAEGEAQKMLAQAQGESDAIRNAAIAEAKAISMIAPAIHKNGENPVKYILTRKYMDALKTVVQQPHTNISFLPYSTANLQTVSALGLNTVIPQAK
jgi:regulator of protease activity HflC (stomatin/prohibitin superfamily)